MRDAGGALCCLLHPDLRSLSRLAAVSDVPPDDTVTRTEHENVREQLSAEVSRLTQLLQGALRKQDDLALDAADAWQKVRGQEVSKVTEGGGDTSACLPPPLCKSGTGTRRPAGSPAGAGHIEGGGEPDAELQAGRVPGRRVSAEAAGGEPRGLGEGEEQEGEGRHHGNIQEGRGASVNPHLFVL